MKQNNHYNKIYILVHGEVELYFGLRNKEIKIDILDIRGQVMNQICSITGEKINYTARAIESCTFLTLSILDIQDIMLRRADLRKRIQKIEDMAN